VIGGFLAGYLMCRLRRVKFVPMSDAAVGGLILAQAIGRWGNFINVEAFGSNTGLPWGMASPSIAEYLTRHQAALAAQGVLVDPNLPVHPTFLYESAWCLMGFIAIALFTKQRLFDGELVLIYGIWYGLGRMIIEGLRTDSLMLGNIRVSQVLAGVIMVVSLVVLVDIRRLIKNKNDPEYRKLYVNTDEGQAILRGEFYNRRGPEEPGENSASPSTQETSEAQAEGELQEQSPDVGSAPDTSEREDKTDESEAD
jgi:phosphatidylglycerol:prolipoprotein diacylglycerol transferase